MVVFNQNHKEKTIQTDRYQECMDGCLRGRSAITGKVLEDLSEITLPAMAVEIIELIK